MDKLNLDALRPEFEALMRKQGHRTERLENGDYIGMTCYRWEGFVAARRAAPSSSADELPLETIIEIADQYEFTNPESGNQLFDRLGFAKAIARAAIQAAAPADALGIPRESNDALIALARYWKLDGDWMTCKGCKRSLIASRDGEELSHASGCKFSNQQHPWAQLRKLISSRATGTDRAQAGEALAGVRQEGQP